MKIMITGSTGMVGTNLTENSGFLAHDLLTPTSKELDLRRFDDVADYIQEYNPEIIIHAAGIVGGIQANIDEPVRFLIQNIDMGRNLVLAARQTGVKQLLNLGSSCMYPSDAQNPLTEDMILTGSLEPTNEGYALAKIVVQRFCDYIHREENDFEYKTLVPSNLYGRGDTFSPKRSHLIPAVIRKIHEAKENNIPSVEIWGDGNAKREFMYAGDLADFLALAIERFDDLPFLMNVGVGRDYTINEYYAVAAKVIGWDGRFEHDLTRPVGMKQKIVSIERQKAFGWMPATDLEDGIWLTYQYYLGEYSNEL